MSEMSRMSGISQGVINPRFCQVYLQMLLYSDLEEDDHIKLLSSTEEELEEALAYLRQQVTLTHSHTSANR